jgi:CRISPR/Cas system CMR subunit Cmr4 (Cas7 group RAMP superfamily)
MARTGAGGTFRPTQANRAGGTGYEENVPRETIFIIFRRHVSVVQSVR